MQNQQESDTNMQVDEQVPVKQESTSSGAIKVWYYLVDSMGTINGRVACVKMSSDSDIWEFLSELQVKRAEVKNVQIELINVYAPNERLNREQVRNLSPTSALDDNQLTLNEVLKYDGTGEKKKQFPLIVQLPIVFPVGNNMNIDNAGAVGNVVNSSVSIEQVYTSLFEFIRFSDDSNGKRTLFSATESLQELNTPDQNLLKLQVKGLSTNAPDFLYSEKIYEDETKLGIKMPIDELKGINPNPQTIIMIGVSGCGKTRTCYDLCRSEMCLYFDCSIDDDMINLYTCLRSVFRADVRPEFKTEEKQQQFEDSSDLHIQCLIAARLLVLKKVLEQNPNLTPFEWLCMQRSRRTKSLFATIFDSLWKVGNIMLTIIYKSLTKEFKCRVIFDECQKLLTVLDGAYRSNQPGKSGIDNGQFQYPRSLFTFFTGFIMQSGLKSIWCGTQMRIGTIQIFNSAYGGKPDNFHVFTNFSYLTPDNIFSLLKMWLNVTIPLDESTQLLFKEIAHFLQGRPRFLMMFLYKLIGETDPNVISSKFELYRNEMTTKDNAAEGISLYYSWRERVDWTVQPFGVKVNSSKKLVSDLLLKMCLSFLFSDGASIEFPFDVDILVTGLVMVAKDTNGWSAKMSETLVLTAGLNYLKDQEEDVVMDYYASEIFSPMTATSLTAQERGHRMELVIALQFLRCWWRREGMDRFLPDWIKVNDIPEPKGVLDSRHGDNEDNVFLQQLLTPNFPWINIPSTFAGPDLVYGRFFCHIKTTSTANSKSSMYVPVDKCNSNIATMDPANWYNSQPNVNQKCREAANACRFVFLRFELPDTAPSLRETFQSGALGNHHVICVNLESEFAQLFFGKRFVAKYKAFVERSQNLFRY